MRDYVKRINSTFRHESYENTVVQTSYILVLFLGTASLFLSIFIFKSNWAIISYPTHAIQGIAFGSIGIYLSYNKTQVARTILVPYLVANVLFSLALSYQEGNTFSVIASTYTLNIPIIFSAFLLQQKQIIVTATITLIGSFAVSYLSGTIEALNVAGFYSSMAIGMFIPTTILLFLRGIINIKTNQLERANLSRDIFMSKISHELKNPIQGLTALTDIMLLENKPNDQQSIEAINVMLRYTLGLVRQLENAKEILDGSIKLHIEPIDIVSEVRTTLQAFQIRQDIELIFEYDEGTIFYMDRASLRQIVFNLVDNGIKYADDGYVRIFVGLDIHGWFFFSIGNKGDWVLQGDVQSLFNLYERGKRSNSETIGQGIGLSLVKENVDLHNGEIRFQSIEDFGILVIVRIPPHDH